MASATRHTGKLVRTKTGKIGYTKKTDGLINGKQPVYLSQKDLEERKMAMLCDPKTLKIEGYYD